MVATGAPTDGFPAPDRDEGQDRRLLLVLVGIILAGSVGMAVAVLLT